MVNRSIRVKVLKETSKTVTIRLMSLNRKMPVPRKEFEKRVQNGLYEIVGDYQLEEDK
ncbi:MAG: hypothetical protein KDD19_26665 [Phaeodactylibacter sp.]|nr:hypothetical protein [Phaeodactylibacter sp.]MCB9050072.1 hypothetical protein [Lewinellaceae bacterium]